MGAVATPALAGAVAAAGGLGMLGAAGQPASQVAADIDAAIEAAGREPAGRVGVNFLMPFLDIAALEAAADAASVVECFYGDPDTTVVDRIRRNGALAAWQVGSADEAVAAVAAGCDFIVVQGVEAGGHVRGVRPWRALLDDIRHRVAVPIVAAGGIGTQAVVAEALDAGADAVRVGTSFLAAVEADVHPAYLDALIHAAGADTTLTETFSEGWPLAPHRVLRACIDASSADPSVRSPSPPTRQFAGSVAEAALYAGTGVAAVRRAQPAAEIVRDLLGSSG